MLALGNASPTGGVARGVDAVARLTAWLSLPRGALSTGVAAARRPGLQITLAAAAVCAAACSAASSADGATRGANRSYPPVPGSKLVGRIAYSTRGGEIWVMNANGSCRHRVTHWPGADGPVAWLPNSHIVFGHFRGDEPLPSWHWMRPMEQASARSRCSTAPATRSTGYPMRRPVLSATGRPTSRRTRRGGACLRRRADCRSERAH